MSADDHTLFTTSKRTNDSKPEPQIPANSSTGMHAVLIPGSGRLRRLRPSVRFGARPRSGLERWCEQPAASAAGAGLRDSVPAAAACAAPATPPASTEAGRRREADRRRGTDAEREGEHRRDFQPAPAGLLLNNCTSCHTFVPIVVLQIVKDAGAEQGESSQPRAGAGDADFETRSRIWLRTSTDRPVPKLEELLETPTSTEDWPRLGHTISPRTLRGRSAG